MVEHDAKLVRLLSQNAKDSKKNQDWLINDPVALNHSSARAVPTVLYLTHPVSNLQSKSLYIPFSPCPSVYKTGGMHRQNVYSIQ